MQAQVIQVNIYMATTITFVIHIVMKGKSPTSNMCTKMKNDIDYKFKHDNITIKMKTLEMRTSTNPNKLYIKLQPTFMSTREDRPHGTPTRSQATRPHMRPYLWS